MEKCQPHYSFTCMDVFPLVLVGSSRETVISGTCVFLESSNANFSAGGKSTLYFFLTLIPSKISWSVASGVT